MNVDAGASAPRASSAVSATVANSAASASGEEAADVASYGDPGQEVETAGPEFVAALADVLTHLASLAGRPQRVTKFHCVRAPQLSIHDYLMRIAKYFQCSRECFVLCLVYIDRIVKLHPEFTICNLNIHRLLVTSVMLSVKFFDDVYYSNAYYAKVGGVRTKEVNVLEALFLQLIDWRLHVTPQEFDQYRNHVCMAAQGSAFRAAAAAAAGGDGAPPTSTGEGAGSAAAPAYGVGLAAPMTAVPAPTPGGGPAPGLGGGGFGAANTCRLETSGGEDQDTPMVVG